LPVPFSFSGKAVHSVQIFPVKKLPQGYGRIYTEYACLWQSASGEQREADSLRIKESGEFEENGSALSDKKEISGGAL
jgi:hypothetical protein